MAYSTGPKLTSGMREDNGFTFDVDCPSGVVSGDVFLVGGRGVVVAFAQTDRDAAGKCSGTSGVGFAEKLPVTAVDNSGNSAVAVGDILALDSTIVNKDTTNGAEFGMALETITAGATANIWVEWVGYKHA